MAQYDCFKCGGSGEVAFRHIANGVCFQCGGTGKLTYRPRAKVEIEPHPELVVPEAIRSTTRQWEYLDRLCMESSDAARRVLKAAGAPLANQKYVTKTVMARAIDMAKEQRRAA